MNTLRKNTLFIKVLSLTIGLGFSFGLFAEAGTSLFIYGKVQLKNAQGDISNLNRGMEFESGDAIITGINGRAQLRMKDGAIFDLKPNTEFLIEEYNFDVSSNAVSSAVNAKEEKGFYRLVRGGFRSISGLIGKKNKKNYRVKTPVATIGIRGTDYTAFLCETNCGLNGKGLYLSVAEGGVVLVNQGGSLDIDFGNSGFVSSSVTAPVVVVASNVSSSSSDSSPASTTLSGNSADTNTVVIARGVIDVSGNPISLETGNNLPEVVPVSPVPPSGVPGRIVASVSNDLVTAQGAEANLELTNGIALQAFTADGATYNRDSSSINNQGFDAATGLYWGRWSNGVASTTNTDSIDTVDLNNSSVHWVLTTNEVTPVLPSTGEANFKLIGNTNPTDNLGNSGVLGSVGLSADFNTQTVDADVNLTIADRTWDAQANDVALNGEAATFSGDFDTVEITDNATGREIDGSGSLEGFFTGDDQGELEGAALVYSLEDGEGVEVEGAAAFEVLDNKN